MKFALRVLAFSLCLVATYSAGSFNKQLNPKTGASAPMPTCDPANPHCSIVK